MNAIENLFLQCMRFDFKGDTGALSASQSSYNGYYLGYVWFQGTLSFDHYL